MIKWGYSVNGAWKLGFDFVAENDNDSYTDLRAEIYIWTRYATNESWGTNLLSVAGTWNWSGGVAFQTFTNSAWSPSNIVRIWHETKRFFKASEMYDVEMSANLKQIDYPSLAYEENFYGSGQIWPAPFLYPDAPTNLTATRNADDNIVLSWNNVNPSSPTRPYHSLLITAVDMNSSKPEDDWFVIDNISINNTYVWNKGLKDRKYRFSIRAINSRGSSNYVLSNFLYTTPAAPSSPILSHPLVTGQTDPKTQSVDLDWRYPSGQYETVVDYVVSWTGPTSGSKVVQDNQTRVDGLLAGGLYTFTVQARNTGDGNDVLIGPKSAGATIRMLDVPRIKPSLVVSNPRVTGSIEPKVSTATLTWSSSDAISYHIKNQDGTMAITSGTSFTFDNLTAGRKYVFTVYPANNIGLGTPSNSVTMTMPGLPTPPSIKAFIPEPKGLFIELGYGLPNGSPIIKYQYRITDENGNGVIPWRDTTTTSLTVTGLPSGINYVLYVRSVNAVGVGPDTSQSSSEAGGKVGVFDGTRFNNKNIQTTRGIALARYYNGSKWVLTPQN